MTPNLLGELEEVVRIIERRHPAEHEYVANRARDFLRTHAPALADMAKRMEAAERDARRYRWLRVRLAGAAHVNELEEYNQTMHSGLASDVDAAIDATQEGAG